MLASDRERMSALASSFDFIRSTIPEQHDVTPFVALLKRDATLVVVGALEPRLPVNNQQVAFHRRSVAGSLIGSPADAESLDFCAERWIGPDVQVVPIQDVNAAYDEIESGDVRFRFVIDMGTIETA